MLEVNPQCLVEALARALGDMAFLAPLPWEGPRPAPVTNPVVASVRCHGALDGIVELLADEGFGAAIAANMLGLDAGDEKSLSATDDALRELMNITAGLVMRGLGDGAPGSLALDVPTVARGFAPDHWDAFLADPRGAILDAEGRPVAIRVRRAA